jgi:SAM-dependent methyltransferase
MSTAPPRETESRSYWNTNSKSWQKIGAPLRPSAPDIQLFEQFVREHHATTRDTSLNALMLGVTPEIATMQWPRGTQLTAVDHSPGMIETVWPRGQLEEAAALCAKWADMPLPAESRDVALTDACFSQLGFPDECDAAMRELRRVMKINGKFIFRAFIQPDRQESVQEVVDALNARRIGSFHVFKWRLIMALQKGLATGSPLADVWNTWHGEFPNREKFAADFGWPLETVGTIDSYREAPNRYTFPTMKELRNVLAPYFSETLCVFSNYEMGDRCPVMVFTAK